MNKKTILLTILFSSGMLINDGYGANSLSEVSINTRHRNITSLRRTERTKRPTERFQDYIAVSKKVKISDKSANPNKEQGAIEKILNKIKNKSNRDLFKKFYNKYSRVYEGDRLYLQTVIEALERQPVLYTVLDEIFNFSASIGMVWRSSRKSLLFSIELISQYLFDKNDDTLCFNVNKILGMSYETLYYFIPENTLLKDQISMLSTLYSLAANSFGDDMRMEDTDTIERFYSNIFKMAIRIYSAFTPSDVTTDSDLCKPFGQTTQTTIDVLNNIIAEIKYANFINKDNIDNIISFIDMVPISDYVSGYYRDVRQKLNFPPSEPVGTNVNTDHYTIMDKIPSMLLMLKYICNIISSFDNDVDTFIELFQCAFQNTRENLNMTMNILNNMANNYTTTLEPRENLKNTYMELLSKPMLFLSHFSPMVDNREKTTEIVETYYLLLESLLFFIKPTTVITEIISYKYDGLPYDIDEAKFDELKTQHKLDIDQKNVFSCIFDTLKGQRMFDQISENALQVLFITLNTMNADNNTKISLLKHFLKLFNENVNNFITEGDRFIDNFCLFANEVEKVYKSVRCATISTF